MRSVTDAEIAVFIFFILWFAAFREVYGPAKRKKWRSNRAGKGFFMQLFVLVICLWSAMWIGIFAITIIGSSFSKEKISRLKIEAEVEEKRAGEETVESWMGCHR